MYFVFVFVTLYLLVGLVSNAIDNDRRFLLDCE